jgi:hypothetical protein
MKGLVAQRVKQFCGARGDRLAGTVTGVTALSSGAGRFATVLPAGPKNRITEPSPSSPPRM